MGYYIAIADQRQGPFTVDQLKTQDLRPETLVWQQGFAAWKRADEVAELRDLLSTLPPPLPQTPPAIPKVEERRGSQATHGLQCPRCGFSSNWDVTHGQCDHCGYPGEQKRATHPMRSGTAWVDGAIVGAILGGVLGWIGGAVVDSVYKNRSTPHGSRPVFMEILSFAAWIGPIGAAIIGAIVGGVKAAESEAKK